MGKMEKIFRGGSCSPEKTTLNTKANYPLPDYSFSFQYFAKQANYRETEQWYYYINPAPESSSSFYIFRLIGK